jgi:sarcosine oxidase
VDVHLDAEVGVIGVGTMGSMALWQLARRGVSVIGFEQFALGHDRGAGAGESRQYRAEYLEDDVRQIMAEATAEYRRLEADSGFSVLALTGGLTAGPADSPTVRELVERMSAAGEPAVQLNSAELNRRFPQHRFAPDDIGIWNPGTGMVRPEHAITAAGVTAQRLGARLVTGTRVTEVVQEAGHVRVQTTDREWRVRRAVVTAGPWAWQLLGQLSPQQRLGRLLLTWFPVTEPSTFTVERFPPFTRVVEGTLIYGMPTIATGTVRIGLVGPRGDVPDPDRLDRVAPLEEVERITHLVREWIPAVVPVVIRTGTHMDAYTPDGQPLMGLLPDAPDIAVAVGFNGRGFKMAPVVGSILAELATEAASHIDVARWAPSRFVAQARS